MTEEERLQEALRPKATPTSLATMYESMGPLERLDFIDELRHKYEMETGRRKRDPSRAG